MQYEYSTNSEFKRLARFEKSIKPTLRKVSAGPVTVTADRSVKFIFSSADTDRDYDSIDQAGIDVSHYMTNPVIFLNHDHDSLPIGKCTSLGIEDGNLVGVVEFVPASNPAVGAVAQGVFEMCTGGFLNCVSIGFITRAWSYSSDPERYENDGADISECELVEVSVCGIPSNRSALIQEIGTPQDAPVAEPVFELPVPEPAPEPAKRFRAARLLRQLATID